MQLLGSEISSTKGYATPAWSPHVATYFDISSATSLYAPVWLALALLSPSAAAAFTRDSSAMEGITSWCECKPCTTPSAALVRAQLPRSASSKLARIRSNLSLQVAELARILRVERPTIYSWMRDDNIELRSENRERLDQLEDLAISWQELSSAPLGSLIRTPNESGSSIVSLLEQQRFSEAQKLIEAVAQASGHKPERRLPSVRESLAKSGIDVSISTSRDEIDRASR